MTRILPDDFQTEEIVPLCIAANMTEANIIESVLDNGQIEYTFEPTNFVLEGSVFDILFSPIKTGIMFLVSVQEYEHCKNLIEKAGRSYLLIQP